MDRFLRLCNYNDFNRLNLERIGDVVNDIYDKCVADMVDEDKRNEV